MSRCAEHCPTPIEVAEWIEMEVRNNRQGPIRFERGSRPRAVRLTLTDAPEASMRWHA